MIRCISKNVLADVYAWNQPDMRYEFIQDAATILDLDRRIPLIVDQVAGYDVILLQEVELVNIDVFASRFPEYEYHAHQISKRRSNVIGNMILWKKGTELLDKRVNSTTVFVALRFGLSRTELDRTGPEPTVVVVGNAHFHTGRDTASVLNRRQQMSSTMKTAREYRDKFTSTTAIVIAGDFNDELGDPSTADIMLNAGMTILSSKDTCHIWNARDKTHNYICVDKVVFSGDNSRVQVGPIPPNRPIPDEVEPSDHFALPFTVTFLADHVRDRR